LAEEVEDLPLNASADSRGLTLAHLAAIYGFEVRVSIERRNAGLGLR
jgi:hypothetical protein